MKFARRRLAIAVAAVAIPVAISEFNGFYNPVLFRASPVWFWAVDFLSCVVIPLALVMWLARSAWIVPKDYGLEIPPKRLFETLGASLFFALLLYGAYYFPERLAWALSGYPTPLFSYGMAVPEGVLRVPVVLYLSVTAGIVESIFMLGLPWLIWRQYLRLGNRRNSFAWVSSAVFASIHWEQGFHGLLGAFVFSYVACRIYLAHNDLWPIAGAHALVDFGEFI